MIHYEIVWEETFELAKYEINALARHGYTVRFVESHNGQLIFVMGRECHQHADVERLFERSAAEQEVVAPV